MAKQIPSEYQGDFFKSGDGKAKSSSIFFACGKMETTSILMNTSGDAPFCGLNIEGKDYKTVRKDEVGKVNLEPGTYTVRYFGKKGLRTELPSIKLRLRSNESVLLISNEVEKIPIIGGALNTQTIYTLDLQTKNVLGKAKKYTPVQM
tara:strand:+ start:428 stop:871 length:444 start_codon:yes stop_codon:yes gene_type:complete